MIETPPTWDELFELLGPIHDDVQLFARRIARSAAEGDDVFQEAVLRAARKLGSVRDRSRFKPWMYSVVVSVQRSAKRSCCSSSTAIRSKRSPRSNEPPCPP